MHSLNQIIAKFTPVKFFVVLSAVFGLVFIVITPPFQTPDEPFHFTRVFQLSDGHLKIDNIAGQTNGDYVPSSIVKFIELTATDPIIKFSPDKKYDTGKTNQSYNLQLDDSKRVYFSADKIAQYPPTNYILQSFVVFTLRIFDSSPLILFYGARIAGLMTWIVLFALAIKFIPYRKWAFAYLGLLPMALFQATGVGADAVTIGAAALYVAIILKIIADKQAITLRYIAILTATGLLVALSKNSSIVILLLVLLIPTRQFLPPRSNMAWKYLCKLLIMVIPVLLAQAWLFFATNPTSAAGGAINGSDPVGQASFIFHNPHSFINTMWNTYFFSWGDTITRSFIGNFGWVDAPLAESIAVLGYIGLAFALFVHAGENTKHWLSKQQKLMLALILVIYWLGVSAALYMYYSPVGYKIIVGIQGRYFLPIAMILPALLANSKIKTDASTYKKVLILSSLALLVFSAITIYFRYYINNV